MRGVCPTRAQVRFEFVRRVQAGRTFEAPLAERFGLDPVHTVGAF